MKGFFPSRLGTPRFSERPVGVRSSPWVIVLLRISTLSFNTRIEKTRIYLNTFIPLCQYKGSGKNRRQGSVGAHPARRCRKRARRIGIRSICNYDLLTTTDYSPASRFIRAISASDGLM